MSGGGSSTTVQPGPFDIEKAKTAKLMNSFMMSNIQQGIEGQTGSFDDTNVQNILNQLRQNAGRYQVPAGTPKIQQISQGMQESQTMPNQDMMSLAMSLYGMSQPGGQGSSKTTSDDPFGDILTIVGAGMGTAGTYAAYGAMAA